MPFRYKTKEDFIGLNESKKAYYLARLYLLRDKKKSDIPYRNRLFMCRNYLLKQNPNLLSILYNYLTDKSEGHDGLPIWKLVSKAVLYDQQCRRVQVVPVQQYEEYNESMLEE